MIRRRRELKYDKVTLWVGPSSKEAHDCKRSVVVRLSSFSDLMEYLDGMECIMSRGDSLTRIILDSSLSHRASNIEKEGYAMMKTLREYYGYKGQILLKCGENLEMEDMSRVGNNIVREFEREIAVGGAVRGREGLIHNFAIIPDLETCQLFAEFRWHPSSQPE